MKKIIGVAGLFLALFSFGLGASALVPSKECDWKRPDFGEARLVTKFSKIKSLDDGIIRKETISKYSYDYPKNLRGSYKYITVITNFEYSEGEKILADIAYESDFRFNTKRKMCECLSSTCCYECKESAKVEAFTRRKNETLSKGSSTIKNKFKNGYNTYEEIEYDLKCDSNGEISTEE